MRKRHTKMERVEVRMGAGATGWGTRLQRHPCTRYAKTSVTAATATQRQSSSRISCQSAVQLTPCRAHTRQASDTRIVIAVKTLVLSRTSGDADDISPKNHDTCAASPSSSPPEQQAQEGENRG